MVEVAEINPYLIPGPYRSLVPSKVSRFALSEMVKGNYPVDGGHLLLTSQEREEILLSSPNAIRFIRPFVGSNESIKGLQRYCVWIEDADIEHANGIEPIRSRINAVKEMRLNSKKEATRRAAEKAHRFDEVRQSGNEAYSIVLPVHSSENRQYLPVTVYPSPTIIYGSAFALFDAPFWNIAIIASRLHLVWIAAVCGKLETRLSLLKYSWLEHLSGPDADREEQGRSHALRRGYPAGARGITSRPPSPTFTIRRRCPSTCVPHMTATTRCWSASTSAGASGTIPSGWKSSSSCTRR